MGGCCAGLGSGVPACFQDVRAFVVWWIAFCRRESVPLLVRHVAEAVPMITPLTVEVTRTTEVEGPVAAPRTVVVQVVLDLGLLAAVALDRRSWFCSQDNGFRGEMGYRLYWSNRLHGRLGWQERRRAVIVRPFLQPGNV